MRLPRILLATAVAASVALGGVGVAGALPASASAAHTAHSPAKKAPAATLNQVLTKAEAAQGKSEKQLEAAWTTGSFWKNYSSDWCAWFVTWLLHNNGVKFSENDFWVPTLWSDYAKAGKVQTVASGARPEPGALIFYGTDPLHLGHVGLVVGVSASGLARTVEGNTGYSANHAGYFGGGTLGAPSTSHVNEFMGPWDTVYGYAYPGYGGGYSSKKATGKTGSAISAVTKTAGGYAIAVPNSSHDLWTVGRTRRDWYAHLAPHTSAASAAVAGGEETVFQTSTGDLWSLGPAGSVDWQVSVYPGSSPSITALPSGGYQIAYLTSVGHVATAGSAGSRDFGVGAAADDRPSIAATADGGYVIAYAGPDGGLHTVGTAAGATADRGASRLHTSPSVTAVAGGYELAWADASGALRTAGALGALPAGAGSVAGQLLATTSPAIAGTSTGFVLAYTAADHTLVSQRAKQAAPGVLDSTTKRWGQQLASTGSPSLAAPASGGYVIAARQSDGRLYVARVAPSGSSSHTTWAVNVPAGVSPAVAP